VSKPAGSWPETSQDRRGVGLVEDLQVPVEAGPGDREDLLAVAVQMPGERLPGVQAERDTAMVRADAVISARYQRDR
jgi:hypothetical protein